jgi:hypothetical protein
MARRLFTEDMSLDDSDTEFDENENVHTESDDSVSDLDVPPADVSSSMSRHDYMKY